LTQLLHRQGQWVNRKGVVRLLQVMGIEAIYPKGSTRQPGQGHRIYPYLLEGLDITGPDQLWCCDITYIPVRQGFVHLAAVMDWWSRYVLGWELSNTLDCGFCIRAWEWALAQGNRAPLIGNTDQGAQFTSEPYLEAVESAGVEVSMDGRGRWMDNRFIERLWRSLKYEDIYVQDYGEGLDTGGGLAKWFADYNQRPPHQGLDYATPEEWYRDPATHGAKPAPWAPGSLWCEGPMISGRGLAQSKERPPLTTSQNSEKVETHKKRTGKGPAMTFKSLVPFGSNVLNVLVLVKLVWSASVKTTRTIGPPDSESSILIPSLRGPKIGVHFTEGCRFNSC
jgi:putative transposase